MKRFLGLILVVFGFFTLLGQELPPIQAYKPELYKAGSQNWNISQSQSGVIYIANNEGLLSFDGAHWRLYPSPNTSILRSVYVHNNVIFSGAYMDFGYWKNQPDGTLEYISLVESLNFEMLEDEQVWNINHYKQFIVFQSLNRLIIYNQVTNALSTLTPPSSAVLKSYFVDEDVYIQTLDYSIYKVSSDELIEVVSGTKLNQNLVLNIFLKDSGLLLLTEKNGFFRMRSNKIIPWRIPADEILKKSLVYSAQQINNDSYAIGTITDGLILLDSLGNIVFSAKKGTGLNNNTVLSTFVDNNKNLWIGLDNGLAYIDINSNNKFYYDDVGNLGSVYTSAVHNNKLYLGTNQGLFFKNISSLDGFKKIDAVEGQVWNLKLIDNTLFCAHNLGVFEVNDTQVKPIYTKTGAWKFLKYGTNEILVGTYNGIHLLKRTGDSWQYSNKLKGFNISSRFVELTSDTTMLVSHGYKGVFKLTFDNALKSIQESIQLLTEKSPSSLSSLQGDTYYFNANGFYKYNQLNNSFEINPLVSSLTENDMFTSRKMVAVSNDQLFLFGKKYMYKLEKNIFSEDLEVSKSFTGESVRKDVLGFENITFLNENAYLIGSTEGYLITSFTDTPSITNDLVISQITSKNTSQQTKILDINAVNEIPYDYNSISFEFGLPMYEAMDKIKHRYMLEGYNENWSSWSAIKNISFGNLKFGKYKLKIQSKLGESELMTTSREFFILKPWFASNLMILVYMVILILMGLSINKIYERYYLKLQVKLIEENNQKLELIKLRSNEQLIQLEKQSLEENIKSKNRELAIATMAIVKKNQFLKSILNDLESMESNPLVTRVIRIIKRNFKKEDDWDFFREAFDNSDKDFLKKLKTKHPKLTHNDMRLCAYLRLNLTSKEIAPLFNISSKSVEIKRYRLRKRMDLSRDENLVDYIINL